MDDPADRSDLAATRTGSRTEKGVDFVGPLPAVYESMPLPAVGAMNECARCAENFVSDGV